MNLKDMSIAQITVVYNDTAIKQGQKTRKGFPDKVTAIKKTEELLANAPTKEKVTKDKKTVGERIEFPLKAADRIDKIPRESGLGGVLLKLLEKGATKDVMTKACEKYDEGRDPDTVSQQEPSKRAWTRMLWLNSRCGYGIRQEGQKYFIVTPKKGPANKKEAKK